MFFNLLKKQRLKLPLISYASSLYSDVDLSSVTLIACQHLLSSTVVMFEALFEKGLKPENTYLLGKCYSTNDVVYQRFVKRGVNVSRFSKSFDSQIPFDEQFQGYIEDFIKEIELPKNRKIILLDDGANLLLYANDFLDGYKDVVGVEQTSSGYVRLQDITLNFPVVNVARSRAKLEIESPMIAEVVVEKIKTYLGAIMQPKILVVGQGPIGKSIFDSLKNDYETECYDLVTHSMQFPGEFESRLDEFDVIIGATGQAIIVPGDFGRLKDNVLLVSASSSDREFSGAYLRKLDDPSSDCHKDYSVNGINLINSGFPINFDGAEYSVTPEKIQLTNALLVAGIMQICTSEAKRGMVDLDSKVQEQLIQKFNSYK